MVDPRWRGRCCLGDRGVPELTVQLRVLHDDVDRLARRDEPHLGHSTATTCAVTTTTGTLLPQTANVTEFYSPTKNISCEIDSANGPPG